MTTGGAIIDPAPGLTRGLSVLIQRQQHEAPDRVRGALCDPVGRATARRRPVDWRAEARPIYQNLSEACLWGGADHLSVRGLSLQTLPPPSNRRWLTRAPARRVVLGCAIGPSDQWTTQALARRLRLVPRRCAIYHACLLIVKAAGDLTLTRTPPSNPHTSRPQPLVSGPPDRARRPHASPRSGSDHRSGHRSSPDAP